MRIRTHALIIAASVFVAAAVVGGARAQTQGIVAGAAKENITPFTIVPGVTAPDPLSDAAASNPDGLPGGLWDTFQPELGFASAGQVTRSGIWGEAFTDDNANGRYDVGEPFTDDPVNTRLDADSAGKYDGVYMAGFGSNRIPRGAFDPIWARTIYVRDEASGLAYAQSSIDVLGWFSDWNDRIVRLAREMDPALAIDFLLVSHTHDHESVDAHVGIWGQDLLHDGTYPKWERYVEVKIAQSVVAAARAATSAKIKFAKMVPGQKFTTVRGNLEDLEELQSRNSCRTPWVFDDELRVVVFAAADGGGTIGTIVNWGTHAESMEDRNQYLSSDFVHTIRQTVEQALGGVAMFIPGAQGAGEVVGDSCVARWQRTTFDGETFPVSPGGRPIVVEKADVEPLGARNRTYALGRVVGNAAVAAANGADFDPTATTVEDFTEAVIFVPVNNEALAGLAAIGVIDKPAYVGGVSVSKEAFNRAGMFMTPAGGVDARTFVYAWRIGSASFATAPGELFPELYYGLSGHNRAVAGTDHFDYVNPNAEALACAGRAWSYGATRGGNTGRPHEPAIREAQVRAFGTTHNYLFGYTPDLLGYIVPGYDFAWYAAPPAHGLGVGAIIGEAPDPCSALPPDSAFPGARYGRHYQETNSAGSMLAPAYACTLWEMLGQDPATSAEGGSACEEWRAWRNGVVAHAGVDPAVCDFSSDTDCVRHY